MPSTTMQALPMFRAEAVPLHTRLHPLGMLISLRTLKSPLAAAMAVLLAIGVAFAGPGGSMPEASPGDASLQDRAAAAGHHVAAQGAAAGDRHHRGDGSRHVGSEPTSTAPGLDQHHDQHHADHGCEGCFCAAAAGCGAPAAPTRSTSTSAAPESLHVGFPRVYGLPSPPLHHDIFRPPRTT
jgi:hypothetical protein